MRRAYHVARADFLQRVRSRKLLVVLAVVAYFGYLVNVGGIELAYQIERANGLSNVHGTNTAEFVGLKTGLTGAAVLLFAGFYLMNATIARDRQYDLHRLVASTTVSNWTYLFGKWLSNLGLAVVILIALGVASVVNHLVHGVGPTEPLALVGPLVVFALPVGALVAAVALFFETVDWLDGTGGNIGYFFLATFALAGLSAADGRLPESIPMWARVMDPLGQLAVYELTVDALHATVPGYHGGPPSFGTLRATETFVYTGSTWPSWIFAQRAWLLVPAIAILSAATIPFDRLGSEGESGRRGWFGRVLERLPYSAGAEGHDAPASDARPIEAMSFTTVENRDAGSFWRLLRAETRLTVRGRRWWWYAVAGALVLVPLATALPFGVEIVPVDLARRLLVPLVFIWPIFLWSDLGVRAARHRTTDLIFTSRYAAGQLLAEWLGGVAVAAGAASGLIVLFVTTGQTAALLGVVSGVLFAPSLALALGTWSRSSTLFEMVYLLLWYAGPLNGGSAVDFVGATTDSTAMGVPFAFAGLSLLLVGAAMLRRRHELG